MRLQSKLGRLPNPAGLIPGERSGDRPMPMGRIPERAGAQVAAHEVRQMTRGKTRSGAKDSPM
jgi:hypothetical protein